MQSKHLIRTSPERAGTPVRAARLVGAGLLAGLLGACAHQPQMYSWDTYQPAVYSYLQSEDDPSAQAQAMEQNLQKAHSDNKALPPGFRAHLGLLYLQMDKADLAAAQIQDEKAAFPEATPFMDFLLQKKSPAAATPQSQSGVKEPT